MNSIANPFRPALFAFLRDLNANNDRDWFKANKDRYERDVKDPALRFISDFGPLLRRISTHFEAIPKASGGSLFRIYRDTRFSKDKRPYKTHVGIRFFHRRAKDVHTPVFYLHMEPRNVFVGLGIWHPDGPTTRKVRDAMVADPASWKRTLARPAFRDAFEIAGDSLKRPPRGYDPEHELIVDLKRKDYLAVRKLRQSDVLAKDFVEQLNGDLRTGAPFVRYLCKALELPF